MAEPTREKTRWRHTDNYTETTERSIMNHRALPSSLSCQPKHCHC